MGINMNDYKILDNFEGNGINNICKVEKKSTGEIFVLKLIEIKNL